MNFVRQYFRVTLPKLTIIRFQEYEPLFCERGKKKIDLKGK